MNKIKMTVIAAAMIAVSGTAMADSYSLQWDGTTPEFAESCAFSEATNGAMTFNEAADLWTVTDPALITVKVRKVDSLSVTTDENLYDAETAVTATSVDYRNGSSVSGRDGWVGNLISSIAPESIDVTSIADSRGFIDISLGGTAQHTGQKVLLASTTDYHIKHVVSCIQ